MANDASLSDQFIAALERFLKALREADEQGIEKSPDVDILCEELVAASLRIGLGDQFLRQALAERRARRRASAA